MEIKEIIAFEMVDVATARRKLLEALGEYAEKYWTNMKLWYKQKITKDVFDTQAFEILGPGKISYHNEFLLSILAKCQSVAVSAPTTSHSKPQIKSSNRAVHLRRPRVKRPLDCTPAIVQPFEAPNSLQDAPSFINRGEEHDVKLCTQNLVLPDIATLYGRLFLGALDADLDSISDESAHLLVAAVESHLKNILSACVSRRKSYCLRPGSHFQHRYGVSHVKTLLHNENIYKERNQKTPQTYDQAEAESYVRFAAGEVRNVVLPPISLFDIRDTIMEQKNIVLSHTVRAGNLERVLANSWHPGHEEMKQNELYILETRKLHERLKQQRARRV